MLRTIRMFIFVFVVAGLASSLIGAADATQHETFNASQKEALEKIIRDYLIENPEVIVEALRALEQRQKLAEVKQSRQQLGARRDEILNEPDTPVGWNPDGDVTIVEFFDYQCPYCKAVVPRLAELREDDDEIRYVYKEWPILGPLSDTAARAALAAQIQGRYEEFHSALMTLPGKLKESDIIETAERVELDVDQMREDMKSPAIDAALDRNRALARALGITGTPAFVIGDNIVPGAIDLAQLKSLVERARKGP